MYLHIRKYQLVNARWRDIIDLTDYEETIKQVVSTLFGNDFIEVRVETRCFILTVNSTREGANKQVISSQADSLIKISRIWADFFPANTSNQPI
ncbi:hypothetical protein QN223_09725 [Escherichia coli]|nr:hypothetical protein [Escherichia coli]WIF93151.1 hypothetical protein QN223_09725 [Escherichia coli]